MASSPGCELLLECAAATRRKRTAGATGYGYALLRPGSGELVATGCGPVLDSITFHQTIHQAVAHGLQAALAAGATSVLLHSDAGKAVQQLSQADSKALATTPGGAPFSAAAAAGSGDASAAAAAAPSIAQMLAQLDHFEVVTTSRWSNGLALVQAEFATHLMQLLAQVPDSPPSRYAALANQLGVLLQLPMLARRMLEGADDFAETAAQLVALRCGSSKENVLAAMRAGTSSSSGAAGDAGAAGAGSAAGGLQPAVMFSMQRTYNAEEGAVFAAVTAEAMAAAAQHVSDSSSSHEADAKGADADGASSSTSSSSSSSSKLVHGRVVGRHRMDNNRVLVVGMHKLPPPWEHPAEALDGQQKQQEQQQEGKEKEAVAASQPPPTPAAAAAAAPFARSAGDAAVPPGLGGIMSTQDLDEFLLSAWLPPASKTRGTRDGVGLGHQRYNLPCVNSDRATHLLQFDGASKNNPGRAGYGFVLYDLTSGRLALRGCMSLPYGFTGAGAEYMGLLAGMQAAQDAGVRCLAIQGDSVTVLDSLLFKRGAKQRVLVPLYQRAQLAMLRFEHVDVQYIPREQNRLADRLATMSMSIDTALYSILRRDDRDVHAIRIVARAAHIAKKSSMLEAILQDYPCPLVLVVLLNRVMGITPQQLLHRLQVKAASMDDPNPWLVQEVRQIAQSGVCESKMAEVAAVLMDSRYLQATGSMRKQQPKQQKQKQQHKPEQQEAEVVQAQPPPLTSLQHQQPSPLQAGAPFDHQKRMFSSSSWGLSGMQDRVWQQQQQQQQRQQQQPFPSGVHRPAQEQQQKQMPLWQQGDSLGQLSRCVQQQQQQQSNHSGGWVGGSSVHRPDLVWLSVLRGSDQLGMDARAGWSGLLHSVLSRHSRLVRKVAVTLLR